MVSRCSGWGGSFAAMDEAVYLARRATVEDLPVLREMWERERFDVEALEKRVTEFQVAYDAEGRIVAALGMLRLGDHGLLHSETIGDFGLADRLRTLLWERFKTLAKNYAMARIWTREATMFWKELGFDPVEGETLEQLPAEFGGADETWHSILLRNDPFAQGGAVAKQQELIFREALKAETEKTLRQAKMVKVVALLVSVVLFLIICIGGYMMIKYQPRMGMR